MRFASLLASSLLALLSVACAPDNLVTGLNTTDGGSTSDATTAADASDKVVQKSFALKIDPATSLPQDCTPPYDSSCTALGPTDQLTCLPTGLNQGKCALYSTDDYSVYNPDLWLDPDATHTFTYISCPGSAATSDPNDPTVQADNAHCALYNPFDHPEDYEALCVVTEQTAAIDSLEIGRCAYFMKKCVPAADTVCEARGYLIPGTTQCSVEADLTKAAMFETCADNVDNNCNGSTDEENAQGCTSFWLDVDGDGFGTGAAKCLCAADAESDYTATQAGDCNDANGSVNPNASESCNGADDDCDGQSDDGLVFLDYYLDNDEDMVGAGAPMSACMPPMGATLTSGDCNDADGSVTAPLMYYVDTDHDGYGSSVMATQCASLPPLGYSSNNTDCDDTQGGIHADKIYYVDTDLDGHGSTDTMELCEMSAPEGYSSLMDDCNDEDGTVFDPLSYYVDADHDGYGSSTTALVCSSVALPGYSTNSTDCSDADSTVHSLQTYYVDSDLDGYGSTTTAQFCTSTPPVGYASNDDDCNDGNGAVKPGATEVCDQVDNDCDGTTDYSGATYLCDASCPLVQKFDCGVEYTVDFAAIGGTNLLQSYNCWTAAGAKSIPQTLAAAELYAAPNAPVGTKYSLQFTMSGSGAIASMLHGSCAGTAGAVTAYNPSKGLNGTCSAFGTSSVNGGTVGDDYVVIDKLAASGLVKFKFTCTPPTP